MAEEFGKGLRDDFILCNFASSESKRCIETLNYIQKGYSINAENSTHDILKAMWISDFLKWHNTYEYHNNDIKLLLQKMLDRENIEGVYPVKKVYIHC